MRQLVLHHATLNVNARSDEGVERPAAGEAPTAFRIWRAGENKCDDGSIFFTKKSAELLMAEQESRGRLLSIDFDHLSMVNDRPAEAGRAAGWHRLETRGPDDEPELWAAAVEWSPDVKEGLEETPPRWRFFSPAFYTDEDKQVTSYINLALCINPMTHGIPLLASRKLTKETPMTAEEMLSLLDAQIEAATDPDTKAALVAAREALAAKKDVDTDPADADGGDTVTTDTANGAGAVTHADGDDDKKDKDEANKSSAKPAAGALNQKSAKPLDPVASLTVKVIELERRAEVGAIDALLAKHDNLPEEFKAHCRKGSLADAEVSVKAVVGARTHSRKASPSQGSTNGGDTLDPRDAAEMDRQMGIRSNAVTAPHKLPDGRFVMHNVRPSDLQRMNAQKGQS